MEAAYLELTIEELKNNYMKWFKENLEMVEIDKYIEVTTPFLDRNNDHMRIFINQIGTNRLRLGDAGVVVTELGMEGIRFTRNSRRKALLDTILNGFGIAMDENGEIFTECDITTFPQAKHNLLQALLTTNDMFLTSRENVKSLFFEIVRDLLEENNVPFVPTIILAGKSGFYHRYDFALPKSRKRPEIFMQTINRPTRQTISNLLFSWDDTKQNRPSENTQLVAMVNDQEGLPNNEIYSALNAYHVPVFKWTDKEALISYLVA